MLGINSSEHSGGKDNKVSDTKQEKEEKSDEKLVEERRQSILKEGTGFDASFELKHPAEIKTVEDIDNNAEKIISGLARNEGNGTLENFEGYAYNGQYARNAGAQINSYLKELTGVLPKETLDAWAAKHGFKTYADIEKWAEGKYNQERLSESANENSAKDGGALARVDDVANTLLAEHKDYHALYENMDSSTEGQRDKAFENLIKRKSELRNMLSTLSDSEFDKVYDKYVKQSDGTDPVYDEVLRQKRERENETELKKNFEDGITEQGELPDTEAKPKKYSPYDSASTDELRPVMQGLYHGGGYGVTSDGAVLVADKKAYDKKRDGKIIGRDGKEIDGKYPNWKIVIPDNDQSVQGVDRLTKQLNTIEEKIKEEWKAAKARGERPGTLAYYTENRTVAVKFPTGGVITFKYPVLRKFLNAANHIGATSIEYRENSSNAVAARSKDGLCLSNQMVNTPDSDYYVDLSKEKAGRVNPVRKQQGASMDDLTNNTEAQRAATDAILQTLKDTGVDVTVLDDGAEMPDNARRQEVAKRVGALRKAADTIKGWVADNKRNKYFTIELPQATQRLVKNAMGRDFDSHNITANGIAHALKNHGENGDKLNEKSIAIRKEDTELIPYIMAAPDYVVKGSDDMGRESVRFYKTLSNGYVVVVEKEQKNSPNDMDTITMWTEKSTDVTDARNNTSPMYHAQDVIISTDAAKIIKDAETAMGNDVKIQKQSVFRNSDGTIYGYTVGGKIYLSPKGINPNTPIHEYTHLWTSFMKKANPKEWNNIKRLLKGTPVWDEVVGDKDYQDIKDNEDDVASEVLSRISGRKNSQRIVDGMQKAIDEAKASGDIFGMAEKISVLQKIKDALHKFWNWVGKDLFHIHFKSVDEVADRVLYDMVEGTDLKGGSETDAIISKAKANGTYMKAPNGKPTHLNEKQWAQVRTKAFKDWFGDWEKDPENASKVVDENGEPLVVYHGTQQGGFNVFDSSKGQSQSKDHVTNAVFFSRNKEIADGYSISKIVSKDEVPIGDRINISNENVKIVKEKSRYGNADRYGAKKDNNWISNSYGNTMDEAYKKAQKSISLFYRNPLSEIYETFLNLKNPIIIDANGYLWNNVFKNSMQEVVSNAKGEGHDGIIINNVEDSSNELRSPNNGISDDFIAFESNQIKSATENNGEFNSTNDDIRYQFIGERGAENADKAEEATTRLDNLQVARQMEDGKKDAKSIKMATGWERGADGKWRYETADVKINTKVIFSGKDYMGEKSSSYKPSSTLEDLIGKDNMLFKEYPNLRNVTVMKGIRTISGDPYSTALGIYDNSTNTISLKDSYFEENKTETQEKYDDLVNGGFNSDGIPLEIFNLFCDKYDGKNVIIPKELENKYLEFSILSDKLYKSEADEYTLKESARSILSHEIQHAIQDIEGFAKGGNEKTDALKDTKEYREWKDLLSKMREQSDAEKDLTNTALKYESELNKLDKEIDNYFFNEYDAKDNGSKERLQDYNEKRAETEKILLDIAEKMKEENENQGKKVKSALDAERTVLYNLYHRMAGEVESRNVQTRMDMTDDERRQLLASETENVAREDQIFIYDGIRSDMGSRVEKRMAEIGGVFSKMDMSEDEQKVADVFSGKKDNETISVSREDGDRNIVMRQGNENHAGNSTISPISISPKMRNAGFSFSIFPCFFAIFFFYIK